MKQQTKNTLLFFVSMGLCVAVWFLVKTYLYPPQPPAPPLEARLATLTVGASDGGLAQGLTQAAMLASTAPSSPEPTPSDAPQIRGEVKLAASAVGAANAGWAQALWLPAHLLKERDKSQPEKTLTPLAKLKKLGDKNPASTFHLYAELDPRGAGVRSVVLNKFQQADQLGRPVTLSDGSPKPLELVRDDPENPSCLLFAYDVNKKDDDKPLDTLGKVEWTVGPEKETGEDGSKVQSVTFISPVVQGFQVSKTFTLTEREYHLGLEVTVKRVDPALLEGKVPAFRYQMTGFHGLPVEGRWYTNTFRTALIGQVEPKDSIYRDVVRDTQDLRQTANWEGGNQVDRQQGYLIRYAAVAVQYFASAIVVDNDQEKQDFLVRARPTLETAVSKGTLKPKSVDADLNSFVMVRDDKSEQTFHIREDDRYKFGGLHDLEGGRIAVIWTSGVFDGKEYPEYAREVRLENDTQPLWEDDVTVRVTTEPIEVAPGKEATHKYLLYNGPVKVMLLNQADTAIEATAPGLVSRYTDVLNLNTMTDYQLNNWFGNYITGPLRISWLLIQITNLMHVVLWGLHHYIYIPYILCIVCLTIMVRGCMFPVSRKQAMTSLRMQQLAPELKKLQEKFKEDKQGMAAAQMELYRKHGVNPFGTCWLLLLQMPIFMGLYYSLQESIHFRLQGVSSWWIPNLAAPDMLIPWTESIPFLSQPSSYGYFYYLGPYLNILPILAVSLMLVQQKWTMPPPTDEQQEQQQKMMKYMMMFMALMFYKVASGLCIYFIASSVWGFMERQLLPKKKPGATPPPEDKPPQQGFLSKFLSPKGPNGMASTTGIVSKPDNGSTKVYSSDSRGGKGKRNKRRQEKAAAKPEADGSMLQRLRDWWADLLDQAGKK